MKALRAMTAASAASISCAFHLPISQRSVEFLLVRLVLR
jgi:hypothetical protein